MRSIFWLVPLLFGCEAEIRLPSGSVGSGAPGGQGTGGDLAELNPCSPVVSVAIEPLRRLSHEEYKNSLSDLEPAWAGVVQQQAAGFSPDSESLGFQNSAVFLDVKPVLAQQYMDAAEAIAAQAASDLPALLPCDPTGDEAGCAERFIRQLGRRLYRRALADDEVARYLTVYGDARTQGYDFKTGIEWLVFAFLNSPGFLYRVELDPPGSTGVRALTDVELASRLSYLLWQSAPDEELLAAAEAGQLGTRDQLDAQARRMLDDPKARRLTAFFDQWLRWDALDSLQRDPTLFPGLLPDLGPRLHQEARTFVERTVFDLDHRLSSLLSGRYTYVDGALAQHYGLTGVTGSNVQRVELNGRGGLFMLGGNLAARDLTTRTSIVHRGVAVRTLLMCQVVAAPPPNVPALGPIDSSLSQAQRLAQHRQSALCASCHDHIDPLGTAFEGFDAVGRARTVDEAGHPVDTTGALTDSRDAELNGPVSDGLELMQKLGESSEVRDCFATQLYRFSMGRKEEAADACSTHTLKERFAASGGDVKTLLLSITQLDDFDHRQVAP